MLALIYVLGSKHVSLLLGGVLSLLMWLNNKCVVCGVWCVGCRVINGFSMFVLNMIGSGF